ncbi:flavin reductase-like protein [Dunaliella salina]|uniref:Flavin reductase-like protein n=1 Tax=Dunaliella salina TaxID=3046 RepID=A0ABQ7GCK6_DUNSA|nr:flavin reductase-like protein [Dunaliella salina]|eukprot:KAF5832340.1 flavin reductase-like protein [Dunaliella salina]
MLLKGCSVQGGPAKTSSQCNAPMMMMREANVPRRASSSCVFSPRQLGTIPAASPRLQRANVKTNAVAGVAPAQEANVEMSEVHMWKETNRLQTQCLPVAPGTTTIRSLDWDRSRFDIEFGLENGTTYNAYLIVGDKVALVDASHEKFHDLWMETLEQQLKALGCDKIDYIFVSHTEPDHSGLIPSVLDRHPEATVCGSKGLTHRPFTSQLVKGGDKIDLGQGHVMEFVMAPNLHWPDTLFTYDHLTGVMYTCDAFGLHYCDENPFDVDLKKIQQHYRFYYDCLMRPNAKSVTTALRKVKDLPYTTIANGHGPILKYNVEELVGQYGSWSAAMSKAGTSVAVLYAAEYGFSDRLSQTLAKGITKAGVQTEMIDLLSADPQEVIATVGRSKGLVLMCPPSGGAFIPEGFGFCHWVLLQRPELPSGDAAHYHQLMWVCLTAVRMDLKADVPLRSAPGHSRGRCLLPSAPGRSGGWCEGAYPWVRLRIIISRWRCLPALLATFTGSGTRIRELRGWCACACPRVWQEKQTKAFSAASFEPLGFTVAVAKDRAIESLMQVGDTFVLNVLNEENYNSVMKHFLKRFAPDGLRDKPGSGYNPEGGNHCVGLREAISQKRMIVPGPAYVRSKGCLSPTIFGPGTPTSS